MSTGTDRRDFLATAARSVGFAICGAMLGSLTQACETDLVRPADDRSTGDRVTLTLANEPDLATDGGAIKRSFGTANAGNPVIVIRLSATQFVAFSAVCTHQGTIINLPRNGSNVMVCPRHEEEFLVTDGTPQTDTAPSPLKSFPVAYNAADKSITIVF